MDANELARWLGLNAVPRVLEELLWVSRGYGVPDRDPLLWLPYRSAAFPEHDRSLDHLDDPKALLAAARDEFGAVW